MISNYVDALKKNIDDFLYIIENYQFSEKIYSKERGFIDGEIVLQTKVVCNLVK